MRLRATCGALSTAEWQHGPDALRASYAETALPVVRVQIEKAGVRLAAVLNAAPR
jgi:hypothetical protein